MLGYRQRVSYTDIADEYTGRERIGCVAEGASNENYESLRQKNSYRTHLWRALSLSYVKPPKRKANFGKLSGPRTENPYFYKGVFLSFFVWKL